MKIYRCRIKCSIMSWYQKLREFFLLREFEQFLSYLSGKSTSQIQILNCSRFFRCPHVEIPPLSQVTIYSDLDFEEQYTLGNSHLAKKMFRFFIFIDRIVIDVTKCLSPIQTLHSGFFEDSFSPV